jgi:2-polyprenyl-3-methyl-5-hydroxy-6-metoxy-1,4-benzoquinol methylase
MDKTAVTISAYNESAEKFAAKFMDFAPYKSRILHFQKKYASQATSVIDLGCGPGNVAKIFCDQKPDYEITGIDLSEEMVRLARLNVPNGEFHVGDLRCIDLQNTYDIAIASFCIVHLSNEETEQFIQRLSNIVNPNGYLYLSFMEGNAAHYESTGFSQKHIYFNYFKRASIIKLLGSAGFEIKEITEQNYEENDGEITKDLFVIAQKNTLMSTRTGNTSA